MAKGSTRATAGGSFVSLAGTLVALFAGRDEKGFDVSDPVFLIASLVALLGVAITLWSLFQRESDSVVTQQVDSGRDAVVAGHDAIVGDNNKVVGRDYYEAGVEKKKDDRVWSKRTPQELVAIYRQGKTAAQADRDFAPHKGRWMRLEGVLEDHVSGPTMDYVAFNVGDISLQCFFGEDERNYLADLNAGDEVTVEGQIDTASANPFSQTSGHVTMDNCRLVQDAEG